MSFFPEGFDTRDRLAAMLHLAEMDTPDGPARFLLHSDGVFTDVDGNAWVGAQLVSDESLGFGLGGTAKASSLTLNFIEDPGDPSGLIEEVRALGVDYVKGYELRFYVQPLASVEEFYAPAWSPIRTATMTMTHLTWNAPDALNRSITLHLEGAFKVRGGARRLVYNTNDHARQLGHANPSYEFVPTDPREEVLFSG